MAKPGPKRRTTANSRRPKPTGGLWYGFTLPDDAPKDVQAHYYDLLRAIKFVGTYERTSPRLVVAAATTMAHLDRLDAAIEEHGMVFITSRGNVALNPAVDARNGLMIRLRAVLNDLGLTPGSAKLGDVKAANAEGQTDGWGNLLTVTA